MAKKFQTPKLVPIDISLANKHSHPNINTKDTYLCLIDGKYFTGTFSKQWYGLNFQGWHGVGLQFDAPGTNASKWQQVWLIKGKKPPKVNIPLDNCEIKGCKGKLKYLKTKVGDPEGIRNDRQCKKCGQIYGCSSSSLFTMTKDEYENEEWYGAYVNSNDDD